MQIPFYRKVNPNDCSCAPVCMQMALAYYGITPTIDEIYEACESIGEAHYTLPWGICLGASKYGLRAYLISKRPFELIHNSRLDISRVTGLSYKEIEELEIDQVNRCQQSDAVTLIEWDEGFKELPFIVLDNEAGVVIPTLWWGMQPHNVVLLKYERNQIGKIYYHDPNLNNSEGNVMEETIFYEKWINENTDNDLLIITSNNIDKIINSIKGDLTMLNLPILSPSGKIIWRNVFRIYPIPQKSEITIPAAKEWSLTILKRLKEEIPGILLESSPDPEDEQIFAELTQRYNVDQTGTFPEIELLSRIIQEVHEPDDFDVFFLLYRLIEK